MQADERAVTLSLVGVVVGCVLVAVGMVAHAAIWVFVGLVLFPAALMYGLVGGGYPPHEPGSH